MDVTLLLLANTTLHGMLPGDQVRGETTQLQAIAE